MKVENILCCCVLAGLFAGCSAFRSTEPAGSPATWARDENGTVLNRIPGSNSIDIPAPLTDAQALDAVEQAITATHPGERTITMASQWRPELRDPQNRWIRVGLHARQHYLCVCYRVEGRKLVPDVPTSTNLGQNGIRIHRKVPAWINGMNALIMQQMYGMVNGSTCSGDKPRAQAPKAEAPKPTAPKGRFCESCGSAVAASARFCGSCGKKLP